MIQNENKEVLAKYKSRSFQWDSGQLYFRSKCHRITKSALETVENDRKVFPLSAPNTNDRGYQLTVQLIDQDLISRRSA